LGIQEPVLVHFKDSSKDPLYVKHPNYPVGLGGYGFQMKGESATRFMTHLYNLILVHRNQGFDRIVNVV